MDIRQTGLFYLHHKPNDKHSAYPKDLQRKAIKGLEGRFVALFVSIFVIVGTLVFVLSYKKPPEVVSQKQILNIQERYASIVLNQPKKVEKKPEIAEVDKTVADKKTEETKTESKESGEAQDADNAPKSPVQQAIRREATRVERQRKREMVQQQVNNMGIFAAITSAGASSAASGKSSDVSDLLGSAGASVGDLGNIEVSKGSFATRTIEAAAVTRPRGERTSGVSIEKSAVGTAEGARIASAAEVNITSQPPEIKSESGGAVGSKTCLQGVITRESHRIKRVYENWLKRDPALNGQLKVRFIINADGTVGETSIVSSSTGNAEFNDNVIRYIKRWDFSSCGVGESIEIVFPFVFSGAS